MASFTRARDVARFGKAPGVSVAWEGVWREINTERARVQRGGGELTREAAEALERRLDAAETVLEGVLEGPRQQEAARRARAKELAAARRAAALEAAIRRNGSAEATE
jgi:hypothetical protein